MSFGLSRGRSFDTSGYGIEYASLPPLPDDIAQQPASAWIDPRTWFPRPALPFELEIGSGKGTFLVQQASIDRDTNYLGVEWAKEFYAYAADRLRRHALPNAKILHGDATELLHWRIPSASCRVIHLYFSDPWPKSRHHKRRVVQDRFLSDVQRTLEPGGELRIVTDHADYWRWMEEHFARWAPPDGTGAFERRPFDPPVSAGAGEKVGTNFERKYAREGRPFFAAVLRKPPASPA